MVLVSGTSESFTVSALLKSRNILLDQVETYFGMRKVHVHDGRVYLNNQPYYQKLLLDQGYWKDGLVTAPSEENYIQIFRKPRKWDLMAAVNMKKQKIRSFFTGPINLDFSYGKAPPVSGVFLRSQQVFFHRNGSVPYRETTITPALFCGT